jgi:uncharacterized protein YcnI
MPNWLLASAVLLLTAQPACAHVTFATQEAAAGSSFEVQIKVPHGCKGSPTLKIRVRIPKGIVDTKPASSANWQEAIIPAQGNTPGEISWSGRLPDKEVGQFTFTARVDDKTKPGTVLFFPVVQECEKGVERWIDTNAKASNRGHGHGDDTPAPAIRIVPKR